MTPAERNYGISDKEALAIVKALQHWRHWLEGTKIPIEILTDHRNLEYFTKPRILNRRQLRWMDLLHHYNYLISYRPGNKNGAADALSRRAELAPENEKEEQTGILFRPEQFKEMAGLTTEEYQECVIAAIQEGLMSEQQIREEIRKHVNHDTLPTDVIIQDGLPYHRDQIYVPEHPEIKEHLLQLYHDSPIAGHLGQTGTLELVQRQYWWPNMRKYITDYVSGCYTCAQNKHTNRKPAGQLNVLPTPLRPWEWTQSDHITGLPRSQGHDTIYVVMDRLTKMAHFIPTNTWATTEDLAHLHLQHVWKLHRVPKVHNTD